MQLQQVITELNETNTELVKMQQLSDGQLQIIYLDDGVGKPVSVLTQIFQSYRSKVTNF